MHRWRGVKIGKGVYIGHEVMFDRVFTDQISIGDNTSVGDRTIITAHANIPSDTILKKLYPRKISKTMIGKGVWIMPNVTIIPGVVIGDESVIATGSVVTKDVPPRTLVGGVPAKVLKDLNKDLSDIQMA
ncbi:acyltransferase [Gabonibacter chumensis]|uniref:acyltransferase n=1 Tax=Gabonibacter chumensis TaxID=2972474 RepID=UPI0025A47FB1|nr:acyltransferase [Gabonibacter chumensis]